MTPGEKLQAVLDANGMTRVKLAAHPDVPTEDVNALIAGQKPLTDALTVQLARLFELPVRYWTR